jgi:hypothetical protein
MQTVCGTQNERKQPKTGTIAIGQSRYKDQTWAFVTTLKLLLETSSEPGNPLHDRQFGLISNTSKYLARGHLSTNSVYYWRVISLLRMVTLS